MKKFQTYFSKVKLIIPFCLFSLFFVKSFSQDLIPYEEPLASRIEKSKKIAQESEFIFQGIYVSETVQHTDNPSISITKSVFLIQYVYKGDLKLGTVILEHKGTVPHIYTEKRKNPDGTETEWIKGVMPDSHSSSPDYSKYSSAIFFCNAKPLSDAVNDSIDNKQILEFANSRFSTVNYGGYSELHKKVIALGGLFDLLFDTKDDFHKFLQESDKTIKFPPSASERAVRDSILHQPQRERYKKFIDSVNNEKLKRYNDSKGELKKKIGNINYSIVNQQLTSTSTERFF